jgi:hypothetical protein
MRRSLTAVALALATLAVIAPSAPASPAVECRYVDVGEPGPAGNELRIKLRSNNVGARIRRSGATIRVSSVQLITGGIIARTGSRALPSVAAPIAGSARVIGCDGDIPQVTNVDLIVARGIGNDEPSLEVNLGGGPLAPGATDEGDGDSEIEIEVRSGGGLPTPSVGISGTAGPDRFRLGMKGGKPGLNLNPDESSPDVDLRTEDELFSTFIIAARGGADVVTGSGGPEFNGPSTAFLFTLLGRGDDRFRGGAFLNIAHGGRGDDVMRSRRGPGFLIGGPGRDLLRTGKEFDLLVGGPGRDLLRAGAGPDLLRAADGTRDRIRCGGGLDMLTADRRDRQRGCERISRKRARR